MFMTSSYSYFVICYSFFDIASYNVYFVFIRIIVVYIATLRILLYSLVTLYSIATYF